MPPFIWRTVKHYGSKAWARTRKAVEGRALFRLTKEQKKEIRVMAIQLGIPGRRVREHFERLRASGVGYEELGNRLVQDLNEVAELAEATKPDPNGLRLSLRNRPLYQVLNEMRQYAQQMQATQAKAA